MQWFVYRDPFYKPPTWNLETDYPKITAALDGAYGFSPEISELVRFLKLGKKLIVWHGTDDTLLSHYDTIRMFRKLENAAGGAGKANMKLYTAPGVGHCEGGVGADQFDMIAAITDWVEKRKAPGTIQASKLNADGSVRFTRPLCEYPKYPFYRGKGDPNAASSFVCKLP